MPGKRDKGSSPSSPLMRRATPDSSGGSPMRPDADDNDGSDVGESISPGAVITGSGDDDMGAAKIPELAVQRYFESNNEIQDYAAKDPKQNRTNADSRLIPCEA